MDFRVGQRVELISDSCMAAPLGAIAVVYKVSKDYLSVRWEKGANGQMDGEYCFHQFKPLIRKNEQLLFSFMSEQEM